ncbi:peptidylprolyl isomerase [Synechococcus sp. MVIR-18-1]|uniref:peptidylprolyl isomerase n=1 Tax=Synechococcus sp. MVIR-18-1 TaxID=1386941 RepID=UPI0016470C46|nr:peptidylprolyl isomerase [Synechococcus sp. MVIR-18-1]QNI77947.1 peptidyl-prolyl cis-trans isomerase/ PpiC-type [Synechococcus sp. MVIR-18-1]
MKNYNSILISHLKGHDINTIELLRHLNLLGPFVKRLLIEESTKEITPPAELTQQALTNHCQQNQLRNEEALNHWLSERCISKDELLLQLSLPIKLSKLALDSFGAKAEARFLQRKEELDQATYSLLRVKDSGIAHELYLQLEAGETSFEKLATNYSEGPEQRSGGRVGPAPISRAHPQLQQLLRTAPIGVVLEPLAIEQWWVVARLEERMEASFDDAMRQRMASELLEQWITTETNHLVKAVCNRENAP